MDMNSHMVSAFKTVFEHIGREGIKKGVKAKGLDGFINECAILAGTTGAIAGFGGAATMIVGVPVDVINNVMQQFRVTFAVIYDRKKSYSRISFEEFMKIVGMSVGVEVGATLTKVALVSIAGAILARMSASTAGKMIPFVGSFVGGTVNFFFIKGIGEAVKALDL